MQFVLAVDAPVLRLPGGHPRMLVEHRQDVGVEGDEDLDLVLFLLLVFLDGGPPEDAL